MSSTPHDWNRDLGRSGSRIFMDFKCRRCRLFKRVEIHRNTRDPGSLEPNPSTIPSCDEHIVKTIIES